VAVVPRSRRVASLQYGWQSFAAHQMHVCTALARGSAPPHVPASAFMQVSGFMQALDAWYTISVACCGRPAVAFVSSLAPTQCCAVGVVVCCRVLLLLCSGLLQHPRAVLLVHSCRSRPPVQFDILQVASLTPTHCCCVVLLFDQGSLGWESLLLDSTASGDNADLLCGLTV
jgi:hypothetical protein